jgi:site-specific recombinase XerD
MHKTEREVYIPLTKRAIDLLPKEDTSNKIFKVISNQKTNSYLTDIMSKATIDKKISFHCARHTFATVSIELGIPLEVIQTILGHTSVKTTQIYAKIISAVKTREMDKWNAI